ncbi:MAG: hypothetical protein IJ763_01005 [Lachnospiraceae bacterium]|nr:hypothetical protein [Lachnospiraceae bacterium]
MMESYRAGFVFGVIFALIFFIFFFIFKKKRSNKAEYDERQELVRGRGYKLGFFTFAICNMVILCLSDGDHVEYIDVDAAMIISVLISVVVFAIYCIINDGYFGLVEKPLSSILMLLGIGIMNFAIGFANRSEWVVDGRLKFSIVSPACGIALFVVSAAGLIKLGLNKREEE